MALASGVAHASTFDITVDSTFLSGNPAVFIFDFIDGGPPDNEVTLSALISSGVPASPSYIGNLAAIGTGQWTFSDAGGSFFNELQLPFVTMGPSVSFSFTTTDNAPGPGSLPDAFSFFVVSIDDFTTPLFTTSDPTGANALLLFNLGQGASGLSVYGHDQSGFSIQVREPGVPPEQVPEPSSLALFAFGTAAMFARRRIVRSRS
ncbi:MAG TPA: PEP-CTERM sorting domain-containing protein [Vicinamibacterales bacterium]|nr:PEP-CTERM sorting domain-containing protein [Vicinamibacterales bacterium]